MPDYMISMKPGPDAGVDIREIAPRWLAGLRDVSERSQGKLTGCWSAFNGSEVIAFIRAPEAPGEDTVREYLAPPGADLVVSITPMENLQELPDSREDVDALDRVDLGSDLSFPASDAPTWFKRT